MKINGVVNWNIVTNPSPIPPKSTETAGENFLYWEKTYRNDTGQIMGTNETE